MTAPTQVRRISPSRTTTELGLTGRLVLRPLRGIRDGLVRVHMNGTTTQYGDRDASVQGDLIVHDAAAFRMIALRGVLGAGEAYAAGYWSSPNLVEIIRILVRNRALLAKLDSGLTRLARPLLSLAYRLQANTRAGSRKNIAAHYDLGNDFFRLFLDETMTYSCGIFDAPTTSMRAASRAKYDRICRKLDLTSSHHVLEIGCGWGGFAIHAASQYGCRVTATTISEQQYAYARDQVRRAGLEDRVHIIKQDYRDLQGTYDRVVSIEMIEAVGHKFLPTFVKTCEARLVPGGLAAIQAITIADAAYEGARRRVDFIKRHIFPGSFIPSTTSILNAATKDTTLRLTDLRDIGTDYATTLHHWRNAFQARWEDARAMGYDEEFLRAWDYYFAYCEGGFAERFLGCAQMVFERQ